MTRILVLNAGSSSLKGTLVVPPDRTVARAEIAWGADASRATDRAAGVTDLLTALHRADSHGGVGVDRVIAAVGHRVVHGGARFTSPALIDDAVLTAIREVRDLAPLHNGVALDAIEAARAALPEVPHVACFDTAFHATLPEAAWRYPLPRAWHERWGVRRYGFHGLSVAWAVARAAELLDRPPEDLGLVVAHLGSGCSVTAVDGGRSADTSMGWTPLEGLMMGTRAGSIDPGILVRLQADGRVGLAELSEILDHGSGLLAIAGTADMRTIVERAGAGEADAGLALAMFVHRVAAGVAAAATALPRLDAIVFTGGIGERSGTVRAAVTGRLEALRLSAGLADPDGDTDARLTAADAPVAILRIAAREDLAIAREVVTLLG